MSHGVCVVLFFNAFTLCITVYIRWTMAGSTIIVTVIQTVIFSERSPVLTKSTVTVPLSSLTLTSTALNFIVATSGKIAAK